MLDTNAVSDLVAHPSGKVAVNMGRVGFENVCISIVVSAAIVFGIEYKKNKVLTKQVNLVLDKMPVMPLDQPADRRYGELRAILKSKGTPIGPNDLLIAAHALALDATLVTDNFREFSRVPGLSIENWLRD